VAAFDAVAKVVMETPTLRAFLLSPAIARATQQEALKVAAPDQPEAAYNLMLLLARHKRLRQLGAFGVVLRHEAAALDGKTHAVVTSAVPLPAPVLRRITAALATRFGREVWLESVLEPAVIGGLHVQVGDWTFDATRRGRLERLHRALLA
jgi:F-type H+-transporting ATPase subunit delta